MQYAPLGSTTRALLAEMEETGADEIVLTKRAFDRPSKTAAAATPPEHSGPAEAMLTEASSVKEILSVCLFAGFF